MNITKLSKKEITDINKLYQAKYRKETNLFIALGPHLNNEAKLANVLVKTYTINREIEGILISNDDMKKIAKTDTPCQVLCICKMIRKAELKSKIVILDAIQDPGNMGTIMRSAVAFGFETIILGEGCCDIYNDKVIRASQGAIFKLNFVKTNIIEFIKNNSNYTYYGTSVKNGKNPNELKFKEPLALILGNEGNGIKEEILSLTNTNIYIQMQNTESLNVAVTAGILMYLMQ